MERSRATASSSVTRPEGPSASSQARNRTSARPSRTWAARAPSISALFLQAFGMVQGSGPRSGSDPAARSLWAIQAGADRGSIDTLRWSAASLSSAGPSASGSATETASSSVAASSPVTLRPSMKREAPPPVSTMAKQSATGVFGISAPRMLKSQAIESGAVRTAASAPPFSSISATAASLAEDDSPAYSCGWGTAGEIGGAGRSAHTASMGLSSTATSAPPALTHAASRRAAPSGVCSQGS